MAESVKKRSEIEEQDTWKLEDMIESLEKFEELMDGVEERIQEYEAYRGKLGNSAEYLKNYLTYDESVDETLSLLSAYAMQKRDQDTSVSENQARPIHTGCLFEVADDGLTVIAGDGYRLALRRWTPEGGVGRQMKFVAPAAALKEVEKILTDSDDDCTFYLGTKHILFTIGEATLVCRILEGEFLDWRRVLPENNPIKLAANVSAITDSIERVSLVISEKLKSPVRCTFGDQTADFRTISTIGTAHDVCQIAGDGKDLEIGFNCRYLLDALRAVPDGECML